MLADFIKLRQSDFGLCQKEDTDLKSSSDDAPDHGQTCFSSLDIEGSGGIQRN